VRLFVLFILSAVTSIYLSSALLEGGFIQGIGMHTTEQFLFDPTTGQLISNGTWEYKINSHRDIPIDCRVTLLKNSSNPYGILSSKVVGEPPLTLSCVVPLALKAAILSARIDGQQTGNFVFDSPATVENVQLSSLLTPARLVIK
jgi:xanthine dehydrogenase/oxidase